MHIGSNTVFVPAELEKALAAGMTVDKDIIVLKPDAPQTKIYTNNAGWNREKHRSIIEGPLLFSAPIPDDFTVSPKSWDGLTPNSGLAVFLAGFWPRHFKILAHTLLMIMRGMFMR